jgi:hypothetical protein
LISEPDRSSLANGHVDPKARRDKRVIWVEFGVLLGGKEPADQIWCGGSREPQGEVHTQQAHGDSPSPVVILLYCPLPMPKRWLVAQQYSSSFLFFFFFSLSLSQQQHTAVHLASKEHHIGRAWSHILTMWCHVAAGFLLFCTTLVGVVPVCRCIRMCESAGVRSIYILFWK